MSRMSRRKRARGRHSRVTPDPKSPVDRDRKGRASLAPTTLLDLCDCPGCEPGAVGDDESGDLLSLAELLENISAEDFRRLLVDLDASAELQNAVAEFGDDAGALTTWLQELAHIDGPADVLDVLANWTQLTVRGTAAIEAEVFTGEFLWAHQHTPGDPDLVERFNFLLEQAVEVGSREALAMCRCLARLGPAEIRQTASRCVVRRRPPVCRTCPGPRTWVGQRSITRSGTAIRSGCRNRSYWYSGTARRPTLWQC